MILKKENIPEYVKHFAEHRGHYRKVKAGWELLYEDGFSQEIDEELFDAFENAIVQREIEIENDQISGAVF